MSKQKQTVPASRGEILSGEEAFEGQRKPFAREAKSGTGKSAVRGRPPEPVPQDKAERLLAGLLAGETLTKMCLEIGISQSVVSDWKKKDDGFAVAFARAREEGAEPMVDEAQDIADAATPVDVNVAKLRADLRLRRAACFCPSKFGAKAQVEHSGGVTIQVVTGVPEVET